MLRKSAFRLALLLPVAAACGGDSTGPPADDLVGTWNVTVAELVSVASPNTRIDLIADLDYTATLVLEADGDFIFTVVDPVEGSMGGSGHWSSSDVLEMEFLAGQFDVTWQFDLNLSGDTLRLTGGGAEWDFDDDGMEEDARLNMTLVRA
ncbi:MAG: hypothetical protein R6X22_01225 [Gemmatimonadota bacterium]